MSLFRPEAETEARAALREGRAVFFVGPRRIGISQWVRGAFSRRDTDAATRTIEVPPACTLERFVALLQTHLCGGRDLKTPSDLSMFAEEGVGVVVLHNCNRLESAAVVWLLRALLDQAGGSVGVRFVVEGALDIDAILLDVFPQGLTESPVVIWADSPTPWRTMVQLEQFFAGKSRDIAKQVIPWALDYARGDLGLMLAFLERLPRTGVLNDATILATWRHVEERSPAAKEIREFVRHRDPALLSTLVMGGTLSEMPPPLFDDERLRDLYFGGIVAYDAVFGGYQISSPAVARIVARELGQEPDYDAFGASVHARTSYIIWQIAALELQLRARLLAHDCVGLANAVMAAPTGDPALAKSIKSSMHGAGADADCLVAFGQAFKAVAGGKVSVLEAAKRRAKAEHLDNRGVLKYSTFSELVLLAIGAGILHEDDRHALQIVNEGRNEVAHFRGMTYERGREIIDAVERARVRLAVGRP